MQDTNILVLVDLQNDFLDPKGALFIGRDMSEYIRDLETKVSNWVGPIFGLLDTHEPDSAEFQQFKEHCVINTWGHYPISKKLYDRAVIENKKGYVSFSLMRELAVRAYDKKEWVNPVFHFMGVLTHICVLENIAMLYHFSKELYNVIPRIVVNYHDVQDLNWELHDEGIRRMDMLYGVKLVGK